MIELSRPLFFGLLACSTALAQTSQVSTQPTSPPLSAKELLERVGRATKWTTNAAISLTFLSEVIRIDEAGHDRTADASGKVEIFQSGRDYLRINKENDDGSGTFTILVTPRFRLFWTDTSVSYTESREAITRCETLDRAFPSWGWYLDGLITDPSFNGSGYFSLSDAANDAYRPRIIGAEVIDGVDAIIVEANKGESILRVWIAPDRDYNFVKYTFDHPAMEPIAPYALRLEIVDVKLHQLQNRTWVINSASRREHTTTKTKDGSKSFSHQFRAWRTKIDAAPDFVKLDPWSTSWIEDGLRTEVTPNAPANPPAVEAGPRRRYVWKSGRPVPDLRPD